MSKTGPIYGIRRHSGWIGAFTRSRAQGSRFGSGDRIRKVKSEPEDATPLGTTGTVLGSVRVPEHPHCAYFVEWDTRKREAVLVIDWKLDEC